MDDREQLKRKILDQALLHVPFEGWSTKLLERAATEIGLDASYGWRLFPKGCLEAVSLWNQVLNEKMLAILPLSEGMRVRDRVTLGVKTRISLLIPHREAARKTTFYMSRPAHIAEATRLLYQIVNEIWYYAGDISTDYNFYTKRALLAWVYSATYVYWLRDTSDEYEKTWAFLNRRIEKVLSLPKIFPFPWKRRHG